MKRFAYLLFVLFALTGCSTTVFESIPRGSMTDCDPAWPGRWKPLATSEIPSTPKDTLDISTDCRNATIEGKTKPTNLSLIDTDRMQYLLIHNDNRSLDCIGSDGSHCGVILFRYVREGDTIKLFAPDHAKVAALIKAGKLQGFSAPLQDKGLSTSAPNYQNFIAGDPEQIRKLLHKRSELFSSKPQIVLQRMPTIETPSNQPTPTEH